MKNVAIITARGGSKRIPKKNIREFCGKPIIAYSIEAAIKSGIFDEVMVSTDSEEIAEIAKKYGASVPFMRSEATANDFATTSDVLVEVIEQYKAMGKEFDYLTVIYPTAPFITAEKLQNAYKTFEKSDADNMICVTKFSFPPQRGVYFVDDCHIAFDRPECKNMRSQDLKPLYHDCGQFALARVDKFLKTRSILEGVIASYELPETEVQDIDNLEDWEIAEMKYQMMIKKMQK